MDQLGIVLDRNITRIYYPIFEVVYSIELLLVISGLLLSIPLIWIIWNAEPLHRNLRIIFVVCVIESAAIFITRPALIFAQYCDLKDPPFLLPFAIIRIQSFVFFAVIMTGIMLERLVATFCWEWYEIQRVSTLVVVIAVFSALAAFVAWNTLSISGIYRSDSIFAMKTVASPLAGVISLLSFIMYALLLTFNKYELRRRHQGKITAYSLSCTYQLRENVVMMEMIIRIMGPAFILSAPAFVFRSLYLFLPHTPEFEFYRCLASSMFDLWVSLVSAIMGFAFPLFNKRFRKPASRVFLYRQILRCFQSRIKTGVRAPAQQELSNVYFESFNRAMSNPKSPNISSVSQHLKLPI